MNLGRFEIVCDDAGFHARYVTRIGNWNAQNRNMRRKAVVDVYAIAGHTVQPANGFPTDWQNFVQMPTHIAEVRDVDERTVFAHGTWAGLNRGCPCTQCSDFRAEYRGNQLPDGEAS